MGDFLTIKIWGLADYLRPHEGVYLKLNVQWQEIFVIFEPFYG